MLVGMSVERLVETSQQPTVKLKQCVACRGELFETYRFCRWCGADQDAVSASLCASVGSEEQSFANRLTVELRPEVQDSAALAQATAETANVTGGVTASKLRETLRETSRETQMLTEANLYHRVSGPLVKAISASLSVNPSAKLHNRFLRKVVLGLISIPVWLMIVLLSPLDAYVASKALLNQTETSTF